MSMFFGGRGPRSARAITMEVSSYAGCPEQCYSSLERCGVDALATALRCYGVVQALDDTVATPDRHRFVSIEFLV